MATQAQQSEQHILVADDWDGLASVVEGLLQDEGFPARRCLRGAGLVREVQRERPALILIYAGAYIVSVARDLDLLHEAGLSDVPVVVLRPHGDDRLSVDACIRLQEAGEKVAVHGCIEASDFERLLLYRPMYN